MSSRQQLDSVIDDDDEFWYVCLAWHFQALKLLFNQLTLMVSSPLCIEEFDLSDKNFKPCPCGYQVRRIPRFT